ncbi:phage tail protein [Hymenobacter chitinivorans]|uniref:Microcystin-dependent protein n=1 Tax=Hymenobacter chitinivorans DSM 11115 TaxID=1121954 RepID=A0A2M9B4J9_9BACT|nr:tail fiber protein [Hymenobacter chitinivorans]PJJ52880.1 microcystin-dependent protein [Hymenobacter chitinivorans DSM 11115]
MADFSTSASGSVAGRRSLLQRFQRWLRPGAVAQPRPLVSMRPNSNLPYVGEIAVFAGNFAPAGWMFCDGSLLPISENETLFQLIGTTYGGDGESTFALPDLRGRVPLHMGTGPGLGTTFQMAEIGGQESVFLTTTQIPSHTHTLGASSAPGTSASPIGAVPADSGSGSAQYTQATTNLVTQPAQVLGPVGSNQPHENMQPYLAVNYIISLFGVFPSPT